MADAGLTKQEIRTLAKAAGYTLWDRPAAPCLSSRVEYGRTVTREVLEQVERGEESLRQLGFREFRVRHHGELARVEIARAELPRALTMEMLDAITAELRKAGFQYVTLDAAGFRSGSHERWFFPRRSSRGAAPSRPVRIQNRCASDIWSASPASAATCCSARWSMRVSPSTLLAETAAALNVGARLEMRKVSRGGIAGTKVDVVICRGSHYRS